MGDVDTFDDIVLACGSGGTTAGVALASHLSGLKARVHGYGVCDNPEYFYEYIQVGRLVSLILCLVLVSLVDWGS